MKRAPGRDTRRALRAPGYSVGLRNRKSEVQILPDAPGATQGPVTAEKTCNCCGKQLPLDRFIRDRSSRDGRGRRCRPCQREYSARDYRARKAAYRDRNERYRHAQPGKRAAHQAVYRAVKAGQLEPLPCEVCGSNDAVAHHDDYRLQLAVRWLCSVHHAAWHAKHGEAPGAEGARHG